MDNLTTLMTLVVILALLVALAGYSANRSNAVTVLPMDIDHEDGDLDEQPEGFQTDRRPHQHRGSDHVNRDHWRGQGRHWRPRNRSWGRGYWPRLSGSYWPVIYTRPYYTNVGNSYNVCRNYAQNQCANSYNQEYCIPNAYRNCRLALTGTL